MGRKENEEFHSLPIFYFLFFGENRVRKKKNSIFLEKMSECLRTYGPQIIRVPQQQMED